MRAIPLLTDWETMSPDVVAHVLAWDEDYVGFPGLQAFPIGDSQRPIAATWWQNIACRQLKALSDSIAAVEVTHETGMQDWRRQSLGVLPAGVFVWKDEFEPRHCRRYGPDGETVMTEAGAMPEDEHARRVALNFEPFIPDPQMRRLVMEGFEQTSARIAQDLSPRPVIVLPAGTESVDVIDIPRLIAEALDPHLLAQGRLPAGSKELPDDETARSRNVQLEIRERQYRSELAIAARNGIRGLARGLVVRSKQTRSPFIADGDITDAYAMVDDFRGYVAGTYDMDVCVADAEPQAPRAPNERETADQRRARLLLELEQETAKGKRGALARVVRRDGRSRQTVSADIERARKQKIEAGNPFAGLGQK